MKSIRKQCGVEITFLIYLGMWGGRQFSFTKVRKRRGVIRTSLRVSARLVKRGLRALPSYKVMMLQDFKVKPFSSFSSLASFKPWEEITFHSDPESLFLCLHFLHSLFFSHLYVIILDSLLKHVFPPIFNPVRGL